MFCFIFYGLTSFAPTWKNPVPNVFNVNLWWDSFPVWLNLWKNCTVTKHTVVNYMRMWNICINILLNEIKSTFRLCDAFAIEKNTISKQNKNESQQENGVLQILTESVRNCSIVVNTGTGKLKQWFSGLFCVYIYSRFVRKTTSIDIMICMQMNASNLNSAFHEIRSN